MPMGEYVDMLKATKGKLINNYKISYDAHKLYFYIHIIKYHKNQEYITIINI